MNPVEIRRPDSYTHETLVTDLFHSSQESYRDLSCHELELAMMLSLEESRKVDTICHTRWKSFQSILNRLKRLIFLDKQLYKVYEILQDVLYNYSFNVDTTISETDYVFIDKHLQHFRMTPADRSNLKDTLTRLRFVH